jgi:hypothetical protein
MNLSHLIRSGDESRSRKVLKAPFQSDPTKLFRHYALDLASAPCNVNWQTMKQYGKAKEAFHGTNISFRAKAGISHSNYLFLYLSVRRYDRPGETAL